MQAAVRCGFAAAAGGGVRVREMSRRLFFSSIANGAWNEVIGYLTAGMLYGCEVEKPASFVPQRKRKWIPLLNVEAAQEGVKAEAGVVELSDCEGIGAEGSQRAAACEEDFSGGCGGCAFHWPRSWSSRSPPLNLVKSGSGSLR